jgi:hypothetical protein
MASTGNADVRARIQEHWEASERGADPGRAALAEPMA